MGFKFRLEKVLEHRRRLENEAKRDYFEALAKTVEANGKLKSLYTAIDDCRHRAHELQRVGGGRDVVFSLQDVDTFIRGQLIRIDQQRKLVRELKQVEEEKQELLIEASKERQALEKLREKRLSEYQQGISQREALEVDDLNILRAGLNKRGEGP